MSNPNPSAQRRPATKKAVEKSKPEKKKRKSRTVKKEAAKKSTPTKKRRKSRAVSLENLKEIRPGGLMQYAKLREVLGIGEEGGRELQRAGLPVHRKGNSYIVFTDDVISTYKKIFGAKR